MTQATDDFSYNLPEELIAQQPPPARQDSRLLVIEKDTGALRHERFRDLATFLRPGDCLVVNDTKVRPARLLGRKTSGGQVEFLLLNETEPDLWEVLCRPARRLPPGTVVEFSADLGAEITEELEGGRRLSRFFSPGSVGDALRSVASLALPPYIHEDLRDPERYQTVYAAREGSAAAPTAGLHFSREMLDAIVESGVSLEKISLGIGLDTFRPIQTQNIDDHVMHCETYEVAAPTAERIAKVKSAGGRVVAVGTTTVRALESAALAQGLVRPGSGQTDLFIKPGYDFRVVDALITNFHLPRSTLLVMVSAFAGQGLIRAAYDEAVAQRYRFFSFGDAMLIV